MKKGSNEGHIRKRKDGRWECQISLGSDATGKRKRKSLFGKTRQEVREKMIIIMKDIQDGSFSEPSAITLGAWIENWLNNYMKMKLEITTWDSYCSVYNTHIKESIVCDIKLCKLTTSDLQKFYNELLKKACASRGKTNITKTLSPRTVRYVNQVIHGALEQASSENLVKKNVSKHCILPKDEKKEMKTLDTEQIKKFLEVAKENRLYAAFLLDLSTGLRRGELLGLRWQDVDFDNNTIKLFQQVVCTTQGDLIKKLKTTLSNRVIDVPKHVMDELNAHRLRQAQEKWKLQGSWQETGLVFVNIMGGHINPKNFYRTFKTLLDRAALPDIRLHDLRHTYAMLCLQEGVNIKALQENLGHYSPAFTMETYGHASKQMKKEASEKIGDVLKRINLK